MHSKKMGDNQDIGSIEWIGLNVKIRSSTNATLCGVVGKVVDETRNTFTLLTENKKKKVLKNACVFQIKFNNKDYVVDGKMLEKRPEERIKIT